MAENNTIHKIIFTPRVYVDPTTTYLVTEDFEELITEDEEDLIL